MDSQKYSITASSPLEGICGQGMFLIQDLKLVPVQDSHEVLPVSVVIGEDSHSGGPGDAPGSYRRQPV